MCVCLGCVCSGGVQGGVCVKVGVCPGGVSRGCTPPGPRGRHPDPEADTPQTQRQTPPVNRMTDRQV